VQELLLPSPSQPRRHVSDMGEDDGALPRTRLPSTTARSCLPSLRRRYRGCSSVALAVAAAGLLVAAIASALAAATVRGRPHHRGWRHNESVISFFGFSLDRLIGRGNTAQKAGEDDAGSCHDTEEGEDCYHSIMWAMSTGIHEHPEWYDYRLTTYAGFLDVQAILHSLGLGNCPLPCTTSSSKVNLRATQAPPAKAAEKEVATTTTQATPARPPCRDARLDDEDDGCYTTVVWAQVIGIYEHPEWYDGLDQSSTFRDFQEYLHRKGEGNCEKPCAIDIVAETKPASSSLFCFSFIVPETEEERLLRFMLSQRAGIFDCDDFRVVSSAKRILGSFKGQEVATMVSDEAGARKKDSWHNSELFASAWKFLLDKVPAMFDKDWVVKADPDCVFFPDRLKSHIRQNAVTGRRQFFANCNQPQGSSKLYGALEVFSREAVEAYRIGWKRCQNSGQWVHVGEDLYLEICMEQLHVKEVGDFTLVGDQRCNAAPCSDRSRAAFHPFKDLDSFRQCYDQAAR